mmetsp:Transcript_16060/g.54553  ORF Transcript_16060/g.54553 Transcript_16060/m.54553 type:complete len:235 (-) Transcript_16060:737-1441(-)
MLGYSRRARHDGGAPGTWRMASTAGSRPGGTRAAHVPALRPVPCSCSAFTSALCSATKLLASVLAPVPTSWELCASSPGTSCSSFHSWPSSAVRCRSATTARCSAKRPRSSSHTFERPMRTSPDARVSICRAVVTSSVSKSQGERIMRAACLPASSRPPKRAVKVSMRICFISRTRVAQLNEREHTHDTELQPSPLTRNMPHAGHVTISSLVREAMNSSHVLPWWKPLVLHRKQ